MNINPAQRVACYIDGFNLYYGMRDSKLRRFFWLDLCALSRSIVLPNQRVVATKYFTARISGGKPTDGPAYRLERDQKRQRQSDYLDALGQLCDIEIIEGHFLPQTVTCNKCGATWNDAEEKMTDVNIATELLMDAFADNFDTALLVSGDSDLVPPIRAVLKRFPEKRVIVAFPPGRWSADLKRAASGQFVISKGHLKKSQLPNTLVHRIFGHTLTRPAKWK